MMLRRTLAAFALASMVVVMATPSGSAQSVVEPSSYYVLQPSGLDAEADGIFGDIAGVVSGATSAGADLTTVTTAAFSEVIAHVNARFPLGEARPLDVPIPNGYNCYAPVGLYFAFDHGGAPGVERPLVETIGDIDDVEFRIDYLRDVDVTVKHGLLENELTGSFSVNVYWRSKPPTLSLQASPTKLWGGDSSSLTATLTCGDGGMADQDVGFEMPLSVGSGTLLPTTDVTDADGHARAAFTSDAFDLGAAVVEAAYDWTSQDGEVELTLRDTVELDIGALTGTWRIRGSERWTGCTNPDDNGRYAGRGKVRFLQDGDRFTGFGKFPRESDLITGSIRRTGPDTFVVRGTSSYLEVDKQADRDDDEACARGYSCDTWETSGVVRFSGRGSTKRRTIEFTWKGRDQKGDTCVFSGRGTARYRSP